MQIGPLIMQIHWQETSAWGDVGVDPFPTIRLSSSSELNSAVHRQPPFFLSSAQEVEVNINHSSWANIVIIGVGIRSICTSPSALLHSRCVFPFHAHTHTQQSALKCLKGGGGGEGSVPLIKVSSLWVVTQPDRGSTPDLLMRTLRRGRRSLSLRADEGGFLSEA